MSRRHVDEEDYEGPDDQVTIEHKVTRKRIHSRPAQTEEAVGKYKQLRDKYETLLTTMEKAEKRHKHHKHHRKSESSELAEWAKTWRHVIDMALPVVSIQGQPLATAADQRRVLVEIVQQLCERAVDPTQSPQYQALAAKCERNRKRMHKMKSQCVALLAEVQRNRDTLERHMQEIRRGEKAAVEAKVTQMEQLMTDHIEQQLELTAQAPKRRSRVRSDESSRDDGVYREQTIALDDRFDIVARCGITIKDKSREREK